MLDPRALLTFHRVCEAGTISAAARKLNISQPSVSSVISGLEARLGTRLFERQRSGIVLTAAGEALRLRARMMFNLLRDAEAEAVGAGQEIWGPLRVGGTPGALVSLLPQAIETLDRRGLRINLHVVEQSDLLLDAMLDSGDIELAFVTTEIEEPRSGLVETTFARDPFTLIVGRGHDALPDAMTLAQARDLQWVMPEAQGAFRRQVDALFLASGVPMPRDTVRCDSLLATKAIVRNGPRVTLLPRAVAASELSAGVLRAVTLLDVRFTRSVGVRYHGERPLSSLAKHVFEVLADQA